MQRNTVPAPDHTTTNQITASIIGIPTKPYDGNTAATLTGTNFLLSGLVTGQSFTITQPSGTYDTSNVATASAVTPSLAPGNFIAAVPPPAASSRHPPPP